MIAEDKRCQADVPYGNWGGSAQCKRSGPYKEDNKLWCKQHQPSEVAQKKKVQEAERKIEAQRRDLGWDRKRLVDSVVKELQACIKHNVAMPELVEELTRAIIKIDEKLNGK